TAIRVLPRPAFGGRLAADESSRYDDRRLLGHRTVHGPGGRDGRLGASAVGPAAPPYRGPAVRGLSPEGLKAPGQGHPAARGVVTRAARGLPVRRCRPDRDHLRAARAPADPALGQPGRTAGDLVRRRGARGGSGWFPVLPGPPLARGCYRRLAVWPGSPSAPFSR